MEATQLLSNLEVHHYTIHNPCFASCHFPFLCVLFSTI